MVGYARLKRILIIVESMPQVSAKRWNRWTASLGFEKRIEFNEGDIGLANGIATAEAASLNPTTQDQIKRFGGSTSPSIQWPEEDTQGDDDSDKMNAPSKAMMTMLAPDGYYKYLDVPKTAAGAQNSIGLDTDEDPLMQIDLDLVKKNYRKLSIRHHPDKPGGDAETFRVLKRAQTVLSNSKLRQQYDILGLDLDDDEEDMQNGGSNTDDNGDDGAKSQTTSQGIVQDIASSALTAVLQVGVRTALLGAISLIVARYRITLFLALSFFLYVGYKVQWAEMIPPFFLSLGMIIMYQASSGSWSTTSEDGKINPHWLLYWLGESIVIFMFTYNSLTEKPSNPLYVGALVLFGIFAALWFRGKVWNYVIVIGLEMLLAVFIAISFPVFEMLLEAILNDKLKKIGDKIRTQHKCMERYYQSRNGDGGRKE